MRTVQAKIILLVLVITLIGLGVVALSLQNFQRQERVAQLMTKSLDLAAVAQTQRADVISYEHHVALAVLALSEKDADTAESELMAASWPSENIEASLQLLTEETSGDNAVLVTQAGATWTDLKDLSVKWVLAAAEQSDIDTADLGEWVVGAKADPAGLEDSATKLGERQTEMEQQFDDLATFIAMDAQDAANQIVDANQRTRTVIMGGIGVLVLVALCLGIWLYLSVVPALKSATEFATRVAGGDVEASIGRHAGGEIGQLSRAVEDMRDTLLRRMGALKDMADVIWLTATDIEEDLRVVDKSTAGDDADGSVETSTANVHAKTDHLLMLAEAMRNS